MNNKNIVILGGYGNFGKRIAESLLDLKNAVLIIAGRQKNKALALCEELEKLNSSALSMAEELDIFSDSFAEDLSKLSPFIVIHTGGPFQGQDYRVPLACIEVGSHYIDLADDRRFVCDITKLDRTAKEKNVLLISGASSVPGLSSVVIDHFLPQFSQLEEIDFAIAPGNQAERGEATVRAILSYTGHPIKVFRNKKWQEVAGWGESRKRNFGDIIGKRWLANIDIPDLELFPRRYSGVKTVHFQAGLEVNMLHHGMSVMSQLVQLKLVKNWAPLTKYIVKASHLFSPFGSDKGAMQISLIGKEREGKEKKLDWTLYADKGMGPYIPTISTIILARKLMEGAIQQTGAQPCLGMYGLDEFYLAARQWGIYHHVDESNYQKR